MRLCPILSGRRCACGPIAFQESVVTVPRALIAETIDIIAVLVRDGTGRRLAELAEVRGLDAAGEYVLAPLPSTTGDHS